MKLLATANYDTIMNLGFEIIANEWLLKKEFLCRRPRRSYHTGSSHRSQSVVIGHPCCLTCLIRKKYLLLCVLARMFLESRLGSADALCSGLEPRPTSSACSKLSSFGVTSEVCP